MDKLGISITVKLGNKERFDKEQIGIKELFMDYQPFYTFVRAFSRLISDGKGSVTALYYNQKNMHLWLSEKNILLGVIQQLHTWTEIKMLINFDPIRWLVGYILSFCK